MHLHFTQRVNLNRSQHKSLSLLERRFKTFMKFHFLILFLINTTAIAQDTIPLRYLDKEFPTMTVDQMTYYYEGVLFTGTAAKGNSPHFTIVQNFKNGIIHGDFYTYYTAGGIKEHTVYENGVRNGLSEYYFDNGQILSRMNYTQGKISDTTQTWYKSGKIRSWEVYTPGKKVVDMATMYYENGKKKYEVRPSYYTKWYENGQLKEEATTLDNKPIGKVKFYNEKGKVIKIEWWTDGELTKTKTKKKSPK
jgi:antitoxin component YwqK of YwqJK toxin-antitoxin module